MQRARRHPLALTLVAFLIAGGAVVAIAAAYGFDVFAEAWSKPQWAWVVLALGGAVLAIVAYAVCYRVAARIAGGPNLGFRLALRAVVRGFAPFAVGGGLALDKRVLRAIEDDERDATVRVLALGALEWALLAPAAWLSAVILLLAGDALPMPSLMWPWAIAVFGWFRPGFLAGHAGAPEADRRATPAVRGRRRAAAPVSQG